MMNYLSVNAIHSFDLRDAEGSYAVVTSDRDFLGRKDSGGILLLSPEEFVSRLQGR